MAQMAGLMDGVMTACVSLGAGPLFQGSQLVRCPSADPKLVAAAHTQTDLSRAQTKHLLSSQTV